MGEGGAVLMKGGDYVRKFRSKAEKNRIADLTEENAQLRAHISLLEEALRRATREDRA